MRRREAWGTSTKRMPVRAAGILPRNFPGQAHQSAAGRAEQTENKPCTREEGGARSAAHVPPSLRSSSVRVDPPLPGWSRLAGELTGIRGARRRSRRIRPRAARRLSRVRSGRERTIEHEIRAQPKHRTRAEFAVHNRNQQRCAVLARLAQLGEKILRTLVGAVIQNDSVELLFVQPLQPAGDGRRVFGARPPSPAEYGSGCPPSLDRGTPAGRANP